MYEKAEEIEILEHKKDIIEFECMQCFSLNKIENKEKVRNKFFYTYSYFKYISIVYTRKILYIL